MLTDRQRMQIKRSIAYKYGFSSDSVDLTDIHIIKKNIVIEGGKIEIEVDFSHPTGFWGNEIFIFDPTDLRKMPLILKGENT